MKLDEYMVSRPKGELSRFATALNVSVSFASQMANGKTRVPDKHLAATIAFTNGAVRFEDLRPDVDWALLRGTKG